MDHVQLVVVELMVGCGINSFISVLVLNVSLINILSIDSSMHQDNDADDILEKDEEEEEFKCPHCYKIFTKKRSLDRHVSNTCKALKGHDFTLPPSRRVLPEPVPVVTELRVDKELDGLLANVTSNRT